MKHAHSTLNELPESVEAEAAAWIARLHNIERTPEDDKSFQRWLTDNPLHKVAFEGMTDAWEAAAALQSDVLVRQRLTPRQAPSLWFGGRLWAIAATLAIGALGIFFYRDSTIATDVGERRDIALVDGSRLTLNTDTRVKIRYSEQRRMIELESGEAFFEVAKDPARPFVVKTSSSEITALGTSFSVRTEHEKTEVMLVEGKVSVASEDPRVDIRQVELPAAKILTPGQRLTLVAKKAPSIDEPAVEKVIAWRQGLIALDKTPLADAVAEMNRYSSTKLVLSPDIGQQIRVSGIFHAGDSADFARGLASSHGLKISQDNDTIVLAER